MKLHILEIQHVTRKGNIKPELVQQIFKLKFFTIKILHNLLSLPNIHYISTSKTSVFHHPTTPSPTSTIRFYQLRLPLTSSSKNVLAQIVMPTTMQNEKKINTYLIIFKYCSACNILLRSTSRFGISPFTRLSRKPIQGIFQIAVWNQKQKIFLLVVLIFVMKCETIKNPCLSQAEFPLLAEV